MQPRLVHPLPPAPHFVGRATEIDALLQLWQGGFSGVVALVGLGGAGKTAVAARFLDDVLAERLAPGPDAVLAWSFYQEPDTGLFLQEAFRYFTGGAVSPAKGSGLLHLLREALGTGTPNLLVLDGLERVQRQEGTDAFGQLDDPLLKGLLLRVAEGLGRTVALVTSRFPLTDLKAHQGSGFRFIDVGGLDTDAARSLLRERGVRGDDAALERLVTSYGAHALTLDHLGGLIGEFRGGDPEQAPALPEGKTPVGDRQGLRLARLLRAYEEHLAAAELTLLGRLCLLRRSATSDNLEQLVLCNPQVHSRTIRELPELIGSVPGVDQLLPYWRNSFVECLGDTVQEFLCETPLAGPEETFRQSIWQIVETVIGMEENELREAAAELARRYAGKDHDYPTDDLPLATVDRGELANYYRRYQELHEHPEMQFKDVPDALETAFQKLGMAKQRPRRCEGALQSHDVMQQLILVNQCLHFLARKHFALVRVRQLCRLRQKKWALAGPLAELDAVGLRQVLHALVARHLVLQEGDGSYNVHPAVRDHFARLAVSESNKWHDFVREQLVSLVRRPGQRLPEEPATLDLVEDAIYHALDAGKTAEAASLFQASLGGLRHLGWKLGEMSRGLRLLQAFKPCPDQWALAWFLRALGEFEEAYRHCDLPYFRADIRLLQGRLPQVAAEGEPTRTAVAQFLMGFTQTLPPHTLGCPVPRDQILLYLGRTPQLPQSSSLKELYQEIGWEGERARCHFLLAEAARRQGDLEQSREHLQAGAAWSLRSGSVEHLCLMHLHRARLDLDTAKDSHALTEGLQVARSCGLGLYLVELLCEQAETVLGSDPVAAERAAREALQQSSAAQCQFQWGAAAAGHLLGKSLLAQGRGAEARAFLEKTLALRRRLGDPRAVFTEQLLEQSAG